MGKRQLAGIIILLASLLFSTQAVWAHPLDIYGFGARAIGMGGAYTAVADDYSALYYNVGGLSQIEANEVTVGIMNADPLLSLKLNPASGISRSMARKLHGMEEDFSDVESVSGYTFGIAVKPHRLFAIGMGAFVPGVLARLQPLDAHEPNFVMHEHRSQRVVTMFGGSLRVLPSLSVGAGVRLFLKCKGSFELPIELNQDNLQLNQGQRAAAPIDPKTKVKLDFPLTTYPFFGAHYKPMENLRFGLSYQYWYSLDVDIDVDIDLIVRNYTVQLQDLSQIAPGLLPLKAVVELNIPELGDTPLRVPVELEGLEGELTVNAVVPIDGLIQISDLWKPQNVNFGVAYDPIDALTLSFDAVWFDWSEFPSPEVNLKIDDININLQTLPASLRARIKSLAIPVIGTIGPLPPVSLDIPGLDVQLTIPADIASGTRVRAHDIIVPKFGTEYRFPTVQSFWWTGDLDVAIRGGYIYTPSPFEPSKGESNLIDSDTHSASTGLGLTFNDFFSLDFYGQYQYFVPITVYKDTIDPSMPFESYTAKGHILAGGLTAGVKW